MSFKQRMGKFFPRSLRLPIVQDILASKELAQTPDQVQVVRVAATLVDINIRSFFTENCLFSCLSMSHILAKLSIPHHLRAEEVAFPNATYQGVPHMWLELDNGEKVDIASNSAPLFSFCRVHNLRPETNKGDHKKLAKLLSKYSVAYDEMTKIQFEKPLLERPILVLDRPFQVTSFPTPGDFQVIQEEKHSSANQLSKEVQEQLKLQLQFMRHCIEDPQEFLKHMPPEQLDLWEYSVERGLLTDNFEL